VVIPVSRRRMTLTLHVDDVDVLKVILVRLIQRNSPFLHLVLGDDEANCGMGLSVLEEEIRSPQDVEEATSL
jgi:hypothetical protein